MRQLASRGPAACAKQVPGIRLLAAMLVLVALPVLAQEEGTGSEEGEPEEEVEIKPTPAPAPAPAPSRTPPAPAPAPAPSRTPAPAPGGAGQPASATAPATPEKKGSLSEEEVKELQGATEEIKVGAEVFDEGVKLFYEGNHVVAAQRLWDYLSGNQPGASEYGYAEFFLARCLDELGLTHAAVEYYFNVAKNRTKAELLPDALEALERLSREHPFDQELIVKDLLYDTSFGYVREDLRDFVEYFQGLMDYRNGFIAWGKRHFSYLQKGLYYEFKAKYVQAVYELVKSNLDEALKLFNEILASEIEQVDVINNARQSVARILFEQKKFKEAYAMYEQINAPVEKQASVFLEEAWTQYYLKNYRRAMGLLYALEAPAFYRFFNPEKHVLKALIYKNLCHYNVAKDAVNEFRQRYGEAISAIYDRIDLDKNDIILDAALQEPSLIEWSAFQKQLDTELGSLDNFETAWRENGLLDHLTKIYDLKIKDVNRTLRNRLDDGIKAVAEKLLEFEEQMNLLEYEIGLSVYKRIKGSPTQKETKREEIPYWDVRAYYRFDGEFWNDELHDFRFFIDDRCFAEERWE